MRPRRYSKHPSTSGAAGSDTDALQTDVMRFMSIIGLCLMAVFALVQAIPMQDQPKTGLAVQAARLREDVRMKQLATEATSRVSGDHLSPGPSNSGGGMAGMLSRPGLPVSMTPSAAPRAAALYRCG